MALVILPLLSGCVATTSQVSFQPQTEFLPPSPVQVPLTVGFYHAPKLRSQNYKFTSGGFGSDFVFPVGNASVEFFQAVAAKVFAEVKPVKQLPSPKSPAQANAVLELQLEDSKIDARPFVGAGGRNLCWAELLYRFKMFSSSGDELASWQVRGIGERVDVVLNERTFTDAIELAMVDAAEKFQTSFFDVPEARRWVRKLPAGSVNIEEDMQNAETKEKIVTAAIPEVATVQSESLRDAQNPSVLSVKVKVRNDGSRKLFIRPLDTVVERSSGPPVRSAPASAIAAAMSPQLARVNPGLAYGPGLSLGGPPGFAAVSLVTMLINVALIEAENRSIEDAMSKYKNETLKAITLWPGDSVEYAVHFLGVPGRDAHNQIIVPVVDLDAATRYKVRLPEG